MNQRNCPNCGAPYNSELNTCPYCGTSYFDMSCINIEEREPFYLKLKINGMTVTQKVIVNPDVSIELTSDSVDYINSMGTVLNRVITQKGAITNLSFTAIVDYPRNSLFEVRYDVD